MQNTMQTFPAAATADASSASPPDFDFQMPCRYFKSSFARSLSLNNNNNSALALPKNSPQIEAKQQQQQQQEQQQQLEQEQQQELLCLTPPPALPARRHTTSNSSILTHFAAAPANQLPTQQQNQQQQQQQQQFKRNLNLALSWSLQDASHVAAPNNLPQQAAAATEPALNVEAVILQNQVYTLQWQLKQTETNCEMYRAVMEEVARFFERFEQQQQLQQQQQQQLQQQQQQRQQPTNRHSLSGLGEQISRSKSLHHVQGVQSDPNGCLVDATGGGSGCSSSTASASNSASYLRARSSTNLMLNKSMLTMNEEHSYESIAPAGSYNAFKDFTWRRSPKKLGGCKSRLSSPEAAEEKLNQEAFRLARTIRNLLHTSQQQPDLTMLPHGAAANQRLRSQSQKANSALTLLAPPLLNSTSLDATLNQPADNNNTTNNSNSNNSSSINNNSATSSAVSPELLFLRANTMRDSRLSLRSSTDSSVHSTISSTASSSSKIETDEENHTASSSNKQSPTAVSNNQHNGSSTEDESGFSSISSFHDVGLPLSSTLIGGNSCRLSVSTESRNSTLKSALNVVGVPLQPQHSPSSSSSSSTLNCQSPAKTYRNANRYQRFSTLSNEDAAAVLWV
ncbi:serine/threonine-protein kinase phg2 [Drosophila hydei]|uniref:Serine/threonine-protein kinase phg2 n=1 Tax=Drosophila hydei TaxID=7224 RepID=A0A6J1MAL4_DROHY|nr:serine/threonine-protein kinase phg2 [Drosophila hydei]